jgi:hypothetical protein
MLFTLSCHKQNVPHKSSLPLLHDEQHKKIIGTGMPDSNSLEGNHQQDLTP